ncbi:hypothetical protein A3L22_17495 [Streptomyces griseus subsp. griseus]|nr:hypothetical protein A3L22_17495 [Streptomyces griseus subsp. griseus]
MPGAEDVPGGGEPARTPASAVSDPRTPPAPRDLGTVDLRPGPVKGAEPSPASAPVTAAPVAVAPGGRSRRRRVWVVAAVVVAVLAAGGTTAFLNRDPGGSAAPRGGEAATPPGAGDAPSGAAAAPAGKGDDEGGAKDGVKDGAKEKGTTEEGKGEGAAEGRDADGEGGGSAPGGGSGEGGSADAGAGGADGGRGGADPSASGGSGDDAKPPASDPGPAPDGRVPSHFVGTWSIASRYDVLQPHTVVIRRVSPGGSAVTLVADVQGTGHCEYTAKLDSVTDGGKRINVGAGVVDRGRSGGMCRDTDPSFFTVAGSGILHDVGPAHGSGYRYDRA